MIDPLTRSLTYVVDIWEAVERHKEGRCAASRRRSAAPSGLSRQEASRAKPAATNAGAGE
jgi:hypothetical protein